MTLVVAVGVVCAVVAVAGSTPPVAAPSAPSAPSAPASSTPTPAGTVLWRAVFATDGLVTNEHALRNPDEAGVVRSADWIVTSGSLFAAGGEATSGSVDGGSPDATSSGRTGSAVLRAVTRRTFGDVAVDLAVRVEEVTTTPRTPAQDYDGVHVFVRYSGPDDLYSVDLCRRDGTVTVKRKTPDAGAADGGDYVTLAQASARCPVGAWQRYTVTVRDTDDGVHLELAVEGRTVLSADDDGHGGVAALTGPGRIGVRGDNTRFSFRDLVVRQA